MAFGRGCRRHTVLLHGEHDPSDGLAVGQVADGLSRPLSIAATP